MDADDEKQIIEWTDGFSGAEIEQVVVDGMFTAFAEGRDHVCIEDFEKAADKTVPLSQTMEARIENLRKWADGRAVKANDRSKPVKVGKRRRRVG